MTLIEAYKEKQGRELTWEELHVIDFALKYMQKEKLDLINQIYDKRISDLKSELTKVE
jgi:3-methyladenine DNA glycosylase AlkD